MMQLNNEFGNEPTIKRNNLRKKLWICFFAVDIISIFVAWYISTTIVPLASLPISIILFAIIIAQMIYSGKRNLKACFGLFLLFQAAEILNSYIVVSFMYSLTGEGLISLALIPAVITQVVASIILLIFIIISYKRHKEKNNPLQEIKQNKIIKKSKEWSLLFIFLGIHFFIICFMFISILFQNISFNPFNIGKNNLPSEAKQISVLREDANQNNRFAGENLYLLSDKVSKLKITKEPMDIMGVKIFSEQSKIVWSGFREKNDNERTYLLSIYDIPSQKVKEITTSYLYNFHFVDDNFIVWKEDSSKKFALEEAQVFLYDLINNSKISLSSSINNQGRGGGSVCFNGYKDKIIFEDIQESNKLFLYNISLKQKNILPDVINSSVICPLLFENYVLYAKADFVSVGIKRPNYSRDTFFEEFSFFGDAEVSLVAYNFITGEEKVIAKIKKPQLAPLDFSGVNITFLRFNDYKIQYIEKIFRKSTNVESVNCYSVDIRTAQKEKITCSNYSF